jgi:regulator of nucleoside diphosphate kinase
MKVNAADLANLALLTLPPGLRRKLEQAEPLASDDVPPTLVTMQSRVIVTDLATGERREINLVYPGEASAPERISVLDPLGTLLFGASVGDTIGEERRLRIDAIVYQPEHSMRTHLVVRS